MVLLSLCRGAGSVGVFALCLARLPQAIQVQGGAVRASRAGQRRPRARSNASGQTEIRTKLIVKHLVSITVSRNSISNARTNELICADIQIGGKLAPNAAAKHGTVTYKDCATDNGKYAAVIAVIAVVIVVVMKKKRS